MSEPMSDRLANRIVEGLLAKRVRSMMLGSGGGHVEVLPWHKDGVYPALAVLETDDA